MRWLGRGLVVVVVLALACAAPASAQQEWTVPADAAGSDGDQHIDYPPWNSDSFGMPGFAVGAVGDVNGDGLEDIAGGFGLGRNDRSSVYVTFSHRLGGAGDALGAFGGFRILTDWFWYGLASAGDVNGDGFGDVAVLRTDAVTVVFGKPDGATVDAAALGTRGFTITGLGAGVSEGFNGIYSNTGVVGLNDLNGDGVDDLLVQAGANAAIVYPPRDAAGTTIDAGAPGPRVSWLRADGIHQLDDAFVDTLGDLNGDGRDDVLVGGEEREGIDQVAYGVFSPLPGTTVNLPTVAEEGKGFELRSHDGRPGWYGELEGVLSLGDQNGDGRREVGMVGARDGIRRLRVAFSPRQAAEVDIDDLGATDSRGYSMRVYSNVIDVGDQNGDGRGDFATSNYVYFSDPSKETGEREPVHSGFYFSFPSPPFAAVVARIRDLNGDGRPELAVGRAYSRPNCESPAWCGENGWWAVDVFDSAGAPEIPVPRPPVELPDGGLEVPIELATGAGSRGGVSLGVRPRLELATESGGSTVVGGDLVSSRDRSASLALRIPRRFLERGKTYRVRYAATNGRGQSAEGPWRSFVYGSTATSGRDPRVGSLFLRRRGRRLEIGFRRLRAARGKAKACLTRARKRRCYARFRVRRSGSYVVHTAVIRRPPRSGRWLMTVRFTGTGVWESQIRRKRVRVLPTRGTP